MHRSRLLLLAAWLMPAALGAQRPGTPEARLRALDASADSAFRRLAAYDDSVRAMNSRLDSVTVGPLRILAEPSIASVAGQAAQLAIDSLSTRMGSQLERIRRYSFVVRVERFKGWRSDKPDSNIIVEAFDRTGPALMNIRLRHDAEALANSIRAYVPFYVFRDASPSFVSWMGGSVGLDTLSREDWRLIRFGLVASPAAVGRRCFAGDMPACWLTLRLVPSSDPVREWYDENDRRQIVKSSETTALRVDGLSARRCTEGDDLACASVLRGYPPASLPEPAPLQARAALVRLALSLGGEGAVDRMLEGEREPLDRLSHAARMPVDSVMRIWQRSARDVRSSSRDLSAEIVVSALFWSLALGALSLRSSRWR